MSKTNQTVRVLELLKRFINGRTICIEALSIFNRKMLGPFKNLCQTGKIKDTKGHRDEDRNRCRTICS